MNNTIEAINWESEYKLGDELVDEQHHQLLMLVSELIESQCYDSDTAKLKEMLDYIVDCAVQHFNDEEALQVNYNFPDYARHKQLHEDFKVTALALVKDFEESGSAVELRKNLSTIVLTWLTNHIVQEDSKIGEHMHNAIRQA